ncbi:hypothetical protein Dda_3534 [Drechslerella dactyloides]|uniref:PIN domain-containing protein n=1 Tax=Drechslerella dactyloides TaxID=74499 RepID=A0AAD6NL88_DREDA|nr:hypothetical protein Dda_3534 [Drechslerella dactyloides]
MLGLIGRMPGRLQGPLSKFSPHHGVLPLNARYYGSKRELLVDFRTTGPAVDENSFLAGRIKAKGVILDSNLLSPIIKAHKLPGWLARIQKHSATIAISSFSVLEFMSSSYTLARYQYDDIVTKLSKHNIDILHGLCDTPKSTKLCCEVLKSELEARLEASALQNTASAADIKDIKLQRKKAWRDTLAKSRADLALACEAKARGLVFITKDLTFHEDFETGLHSHGITTYAIKFGAKGSGGQKGGLGS